MKGRNYSTWALKEFVVSIVQPRPMPIIEPEILIAKTGEIFASSFDLLLILRRCSPVSDRDDQSTCVAPISRAVTIFSPTPPPPIRKFQF